MPLPRQTQAGAALVLVLVTLLLLSTVMLHVAQQAVDVAEGHIFLTQSTHAALQAEAAREIAVGMLASLGVDSSPDQAPQSVLAWEQASLRITILPANARLNLNALGRTSAQPGLRQRLDRAMGLLLAEAAPQASLEDILDWITPEADHSPAARRRMEGRYDGLRFAYNPRGGPLERPEELLLVRGFEALDPALVREAFTVWGDDHRVNLNAAPREVLLALAPELGPHWPAIDARRTEHGFARPDELLSQVRLPMDVYQKILPLIRVDADVYEALVEINLPAWFELHRFILERPPLQADEPARLLAADILEARAKTGPGPAHGQPRQK